MLTKCPKIKMVYPRSTKEMGGEANDYATVTEKKAFGKQNTRRVDGVMARMGGNHDVTAISQKAEQ